MADAGAAMASPSSRLRESVRSARARIESRIAEDHIARLPLDALVEEHRRSPFGEHSPSLAFLLMYLRRGRSELLDVIVDVGAGTTGPYALGAIVSDELVIDESPVVACLEDAEHALFERRLVRVRV